MIDINLIQRNLPVFVEGLHTTLILSALAFVLSLIWGLVVVAGRISGVRGLPLLARAFVELMRNTPVLVIMYFIFFGSAVVGYPLSGFVAGLIALTLQNGAYLSEIYRAGIEAVSQRQAEAGLALGMLKRQAFLIVVLPQAIRRMIPPIANQGVIIIKDTALVSTLSVAELMYHARMVADRTAASYEVFLTLAIFYLAITSIFTFLMRLIEWRVRIVD